jgi:hypothetical protein
MTTKLLAALVLALLHAATYAQDVAANAPAEESNAIGTILFGIVFVGACIGFVWLVWRNDKKQKERRTQEAKESSGKKS